MTAEPSYYHRPSWTPFNSPLSSERPGVLESSLHSADGGCICLTVCVQRVCVWLCWLRLRLHFHSEALSDVMFRSAYMTPPDFPLNITGWWENPKRISLTHDIVFTLAPSGATFGFKGIKIMTNQVYWSMNAIIFYRDFSKKNFVSLLRLNWKLWFKLGSINCTLLYQRLT